MSKTARTYTTDMTDPVIFVYPKFETPDVYVKDGVAGKPSYKTDAKEHPDHPGSMAKLQAKVTAELVKLFPDMDPKTRRRTLKNGDTKTLYWPFKTDKEGTVTLTAKTARTHSVKAAETEAAQAAAEGRPPKFRAGELMRVPMFGANNKKIPDGIYPGGGTIGRLDLTLNAMPNEGGINYYINAVQVLKLEESSFGKSNFEPTDGYVYEAEEPKERTSFDETSTADESDATKF